MLALLGVSPGQRLSRDQLIATLWPERDTEGGRNLLKVATYVGFATALSAFVFAAFMLVKTIAFGDPARGFPTLIVVISFLGGLQLMAIGVLGEYLARLFVESKGRPLYIVDELRAPAGATQLPWSRPRVEHASARSQIA